MELDASRSVPNDKGGMGVTTPKRHAVKAGYSRRKPNWAAIVTLVRAYLSEIEPALFFPFMCFRKAPCTELQQLGDREL